MKTARFTFDVEYDEDLTNPDQVAQVLGAMRRTGLTNGVRTLKQGYMAIGDFSLEGSARAALAGIYEALFSDGDDWDPDKEWDSETINDVAQIVFDVMPDPNTLQKGDDVREMIK